MNPTELAQAISGSARTIRESLLAMSYTERKPGCWLKPIGYQCFTYHEGRNEWANWFFTGQGNIGLWETKKFEDDFKRCGDYLRQLKEWECWTRTDMYVNGQSHFELEVIDL